MVEIPTLNHESAVLRELTPNVYQLVLEAVTRGQGPEAEPAAAPGKAAGKGARVGRLNSALVFAIETFEGLLIQLDKSGARPRVWARVCFYTSSGVNPE